MAWVWIFGILAALLVAFGLWAICAAGPKDSADAQWEDLRRQYAEQQRRKITVRDSSVRRRK